MAINHMPASGIGCGTGIGQLCFVSDSGGKTAYQYNTLGQLTYVSESRGAVNFATTYAWDKAGFLTGITLPSGRTITYTSNANGQVASVVGRVNGSNVTLASSITYLPFGPLTTMTYGNTRTFTGSYNTDYNPTSMAVSSIYTNTYTTDNVGNITKAGTPTYGYDSLLRLSSESGTTQYTYDATSNRATKVLGGTTTTTIPSTSNRISAVGSNTITYDSSGNILTYVSSAYNWNAANQLSFVSTSGSTVGTYTYNYLNQRTQKLVSGTTTHYVYGQGGLLYGEYTSAGALVREYIYLNGQPLAQVTAGSPEFVTYMHPDHLGTPRYGTNAAGTQVWNWTSDAFGNGTPTGSATVNLRMPGQYYDSESGLFYNWNRYYNPTLGRFITSDPIGLDGGLNTFNYVEQNPLLYADSSGLVWDTLWDAGNVAYDIWAGQWGDLAADTVAMCIPFVPAGVTKLARINKLKPISEAVGSHTVWKTDKSGKITRHETFTPNPKNPTGFDSTQSTDLTGTPHINKVTEESVATPHTQGKDIPGGVRPATPEEIPKQIPKK